VFSPKKWQDLRVRRLLLVNALIFAVLAAAIALAYYSFSYSTVWREQEEKLLKDLAEEKVLNIESLIDDKDTKLFKEIQLDQMVNLGELVKTTSAAVASVYVLDDHLQLIPGGHFSISTRSDKEAVAITEWFMRRVVAQLGLP
jgi:hypothetical protein